jgi:uncharacterized hydantoinase/oxoprolinase family protein
MQQCDNFFTRTNFSYIPVWRKHKKLKEIYRVVQKSRYREKTEYLHYGSTKWAHFFTKDRHMFTLQIYTNKVSETLC